MPKVLLHTKSQFNRLFDKRVIINRLWRVRWAGTCPWSSGRSTGERPRRWECRRRRGTSRGPTSRWRGLRSRRLRRSKTKTFEASTPASPSTTCTPPSAERRIGYRRTEKKWIIVSIKSITYWKNKGMFVSIKSIIRLSIKKYCFSIKKCIIH